MDMHISDLIRKLENIRDQHGNILVFHLHDGVYCEPNIEVESSVRELNEDTLEMEEIKTPTMALIH